MAHLTSSNLSAAAVLLEVRSRGGPRQRSGDDVVHPLKFSLEDVYFGTSNSSHFPGMNAFFLFPRKVLWKSDIREPRTKDDGMDLSSYHLADADIVLCMHFGSEVGGVPGVEKNMDV
ncbi:hypothetical protein FEM48_Zijuj03G0030600 [Ziziphus jujuba var. spinosa]|uniref:Uncharacterized protein n=1 Tax=Ziziphus jujuba var. spinosa TaxID=714518 RepID=A0A978VMT1_ZIZJJ|nr:hypothetical protein FEM48_Zijuj03G0030600 [Ziziphus jujuba var. spinosa]